jgi:L-threonylcarbamoyladenylate synthase
VAEVLRVDGARPDRDVLVRAIALLRDGRLLVYPTDTLYALGGCGLDAAVAAAVRAAKGRGDDKPLPLIASDAEQARRLAAAWPPTAERLAERFWPGPLTLVLAAADAVPGAVTSGGGTVAVRVPALDLARRLAEGAGPLIATSANRSGEPPPTTCAEAMASVGDAAALALDAGPGRTAASTIVDLTGREPLLLRAGAVEWDHVRRVLELD